MLARLLTTGLVASAVLVGLTGCVNELDTRTLHGDAARDALIKVVDESVAEFKKLGGTEQVTLAGGQYGIIYDASAPAGKNVAMINVATPDAVATRGADSYLFLFALPKMIKDGTFTNGQFDYAKSQFTVTNGVMKLQVYIESNRVNGTELSKTSTDGTMTQSTIENYGISDVAKAQVAKATPQPTPKPAK